MASIGISEFTFGYAFLYEQTSANWGGLRAAPILPSLRKEHEEGWDAHLPVSATDFYFQFKLTDYLSHGNASFIADGTYAGPYYRLAFHRKNNNRQHQRLRGHSVANPHTYYVAPEFNSIDDFNAAFLGQQLTNESRIIPIEDCDDVFDADQHYITFQPSQVDWIQHSEKKRHERSFTGRDMRRIYRDSDKDWKRVDRAFAMELFDRTAEVVAAVLRKEEPRAMLAAQPLLDFNPHTAERKDIFMRTSQILSVVLGVALVLVGTGE